MNPNNNNNNNDPDTEECVGSSPSFANDIVPIINASCALSNCHVGGFPSGDFTSYAGLKAKADNGTLRTRVFVSRNMPPSNSAGPDPTDDQRELIACWIADGAQDN